MSRTPRYIPPFTSPYPHTKVFSTHISEQHTYLISPRYFSGPCYMASTAHINTFARQYPDHHIPRLGYIRLGITNDCG